jgi:hypothetical protein
MDTEDVFQDPINLYIPANLEAGSSWFEAELTMQTSSTLPPDLLPTNIWSRSRR